MPLTDMKNTILIIAIVGFLALVGCREYQQPLNTTTEFHQLGEIVKVINIDSCEYIFASTDMMDGGVSIVHKQNCKYCKQRK